MKQRPIHKIMLPGVGLILLLATLYGIFTSTFGPQKYSWRDSFSRKSKAPYGDFILYEMIGNLFVNDSLREVKLPVLEQLAFHKYNHTGYIFITDELNLDETDVEEMIRYVNEGNDVFIAAHYFPPALRTYLGFESRYFGESEADSLDIRFTLENGPEDLYRYPSAKMAGHFFAWDDFRTKVLAETSDGHAKLLEIRVGDGKFVLSCDPRAFTNYYMVHPQNHQYISRALSFLPQQQAIFWDEYYKKNNYNKNDESGENLSAWDYMMSQEALRWGFWLFLVAIFIYAVFEGKRTQRLVPVINPLPNTTLEFTETIGRLYYQQENHYKIASKRIRVLLEYIRSRYYLKTQMLDEEFVRALSGKSGIAETEIKKLFEVIEHIRKKETISEDELIYLNTLVEDFYRQA